MMELEFMGFLLSEKGIGSTSAKVEAVRNTQRPKSLSGVRNLLGPVSFSAQFIDDLATKMEPLWKLMQKNVLFKCQTEQEKAFKHLKEDLAQVDRLAYFDPKA